MVSGHEDAKCMFSNKPLETDLPPLSSCFQRFKWKVMQLLLPCAWHHNTVFYIRSQKGLRLERERQILTARCFIWHPYSPLRYYWNCVSVFFDYIFYIYMPFQVFTVCPSPYDKFVLFNDALGFIGIITNFVTGYSDEDKKIIVLKPKLIALNYIKHYFFLDFIGSLPLQLLDPYRNCHYPFHTVMYVFKLLRLPSHFKRYTSVCNQLKCPYLWYVVSKCVIKAILFFHWMVYFHYQLPVMWANFYTEEMIDANHVYIKNWLALVLVGDVSLFKKYVDNLYFVSRMAIGAKYYSINHQDIIGLKLLQNAFIGILGLLFIIYLLMSLLSLVIHRQTCTSAFNGRLKELEEYIVQMCLPKYLQEKIKMYINYKYNGEYFNDEMILSTINTQIKNDINMHFCKRLVLNVPLFQGLPAAVINSIIFSLTHVLYTPGKVVISYGNTGSSMYFIASGSVAVLNANGKEIAHMKDGAYFGEICLLYPTMKRQTTIIALEITEMYKLRREVFDAILLPRPHLRRRLQRAHRTYTD